MLDRLIGREDHLRGGGGAAAQLQLGDVVVMLEQALAGAEHERWIINRYSIAEGVHAIPFIREVCV